MRILLTNDDGINAEGLLTLADFLEKEGYDIYIVAPDTEKSASSHSITLTNPLRVIQHSTRKFSVTGSPADCVILAFEIIIKEKIDLVISGVNRGQNLCEDILYSGTVAAAIEAMHFGYPSIAVSLAVKEDFNFYSAANVVSVLLKKNLHKTLVKDEILNINVPDIAFNKIKGFKLTRTGHRKYHDFITRIKDPRGREVYWFGGKQPLWENDEGTDSHAIANNFVSITPVTPAFTNFNSFGRIEKFLLGENLNEI